MASNLSLAATVLAYVPVAAYSAATHIVNGPVKPSWTLKTSLIIALANATTDSNKNRPKSSSSSAPSGSGDGNLDAATRSEAERAIKVRNAIDYAVERFSPTLKNGFFVKISIPVRPIGQLVPPLDELDRTESGTRTINAEWTVANEVYEHRDKSSGKVVLFFHGGGFVICSPATHRPVVILLSKMLNCRVLSIDYRLAPETVFPGALQDAVVSYNYLINDLNVPPQNVYLAGDSAGGCIAAALMIYLRDAKMPAPGGVILISPATDLTRSLKSWEDNSHTDFLPTPSLDEESASGSLYLSDISLRTHPYVSPALADLHNLPPVLIQCGGSETLRDDSVLLADRLYEAKNDVRLELWQDGIHVAHVFGGPIAEAQFEAIGKWGESRPDELPCDFTSIDELLEPEWQRRLGNSSIRRAMQKRARDSARTFLFEAKQERAPRVEVRTKGHERVKELVEGLAQAGSEGCANTWVYEARRQPSGTTHG